MASKKAAPVAAPETVVAEAAAAVPEEVVHGVKGFDRNWECRGYKFEVGKTYTHDGPVVACASGFHAIEGHPLEVFRYYPPGKSRYALTTQGGSIARDGDNAKVASAKITIEAEIKLPDLIQRAVKWVFDRAKWSDGPAVAGDNEGATASGESGAATASGSYGAATASGESGAATASGRSGKVSGADGCALFLVYGSPNEPRILHAWAGVVGRDGIKPDTFYTLGADGRPVGVSP